MSIDALEELKNDFLVYAKEVNTNRSFPDAMDGLKPGQRAILYTMYNHGFSSAKPHVKSAKVSGTVVAEYWPHGDQGVYEAMVRMSQPWVNNLPEIDWHGGNGSQIGGPEAAASRYTECRLSKASEDGFFRNIDKDTTPWIKNFSEDLEWPVRLPGILPRLFVNGSQGIGYTIAQEWEPGNLNEFTDKVKEFLAGKFTCDNIFPDYPTGGIIVNQDNIKELYETGHGQVILRGKAEIDENVIRITELPYQVYAEDFIQSVKDLVNGGKLYNIEDICNKSDDGGMLIEIICDGDKITADTVLTNLYNKTALQTTFNANMMALVDGNPTILNLKDYIKIYVEHAEGCLKREFEYDLNKYNNKEEILIGITKAIDEVDKVISIIRSSKSSADAVSELIKQLLVTEKQAKAIIDIRLGKLANTEKKEIESELSELTKKICEVKKKLSNIEKSFISCLDDFTKKYGWARRTEVKQINFEVEKKEARAKKKVKKEQEKYIVILEDNRLKRIPVSLVGTRKKYENSVTVTSADKVITISESGMVNKIKVNKIPTCRSKSAGKLDLTTEFKDKFIKILSGQEDKKFILLLDGNGLAKKMFISDLVKRSRPTDLHIEISQVFLVNDDDVITITYRSGDKVKEKRILASEIPIKTSKALPRKIIKQEVIKISV